MLGATDADRSRYATWTRYDYEEDGSAANQQALAAMLAITPAQFTQLLAWQNHGLTTGNVTIGFGSALAHTGNLPAQHARNGYGRVTLTTDAVGGTVPLPTRRRNEPLLTRLIRAILSGSAPTHHSCSGRGR